MTASKRDLWLSYRRGWSDGAASRAKRAEFATHTDTMIGVEYDRGYQEGALERTEAVEYARNRLGVEPDSILRDADAACE